MTVLEKKNHHYVPQFYLRKFSNDGRSIGIYLLDKKKYIPCASIKKTAYREHLYGEDNSIENRLANDESEWSKIINKIIDSENLDLDQEEYIMLLLFITMSEARTSQTADYNNAEISTLSKLILKMKNIPSGNVDIHFNTPNLVSLKSAIEITPILSDLNVLLIINESNRDFITTDNPVVRYNQFFMFRNYDRNYGLGQMGIQLFVPLNPRICLCLYDGVMYTPKTKHIIKINSGSQINELNKLFILNAYEYIFFRNNQKESYIKSISRYSNGKKVFDIPVLGAKNSYVIPMVHESVKERIKLNFFDISPELANMPLPSHMAGPIRPIAEKIIEEINHKK